MAARSMRVLLVSMPWHALDRPSIGLSLLRAALLRAGHRCDVRYLGFPFADSIGIDDYLWVHGELPYTAFAGDWLFTEALHGSRPARDEDYVRSVLRGEWRRSQADVDRLRRIRARIEPFLRHCLDTVPWQEYDVVGFTSTFEQNIASLALAGRVKAACPDVQVVFGGANWEGEMGQALQRQFDFVDVVASGEADLSFPAYIDALATGGDPAAVPGLFVRAPESGVVVTPGADLVRDLDSLPVPSYDDYLEQLDASPACAGVLPTLLLETSRGCWWGAKHHCTFCGLNGGSMAYRSKSARRALEEIDGLRASGAGSVSVVDNILDMHYFTDLLPEMADRGIELDLFYEVKANLSRGQIRALARAGIRHVQPGIESLSDTVLALMRKGTTALQNIQLLKWCAEYSVVPEWNFLYGFPGEDPEEYARMADLVGSLGHLQPPSGAGPLRLDRFSPYHDDPAGFGLTAVRPIAPYPFLYDSPPDELMRIAYYFDFDYADGRDLGYVGDALERFTAWARSGPTGTLTVRRQDDGSAVILDTRDGEVRAHGLLPWQADVLDAIDGVAAESAILRSAPVQGVTADDVRGFLQALLTLRLAVTSGDRWLGLPVHDPPRWDDQPARRRLVLQEIR